MAIQKLPIFVEVPTPDTSAIEQQIAEIAGRLQSHDARLAALEAGVVPEPEPEPEPEPPIVDPEPEPPTGIAITLPSGETWTGLTNPPSVTTFRTDHPRLLVTPETLPALQEKLSHPVYAGDVTRLQASGNASDKAFCYLVWGDEVKGHEAIASLLAWSFGEWGGMPNVGKRLQGPLMYDWLYNLMTPEERVQAASVIRANGAATGGLAHYYHSDHWDRGAAMSILEALTVDNDWSMAERQKLLDPNYTGFKIYRGALDILTQKSLQHGGGWHGGQTSSAIYDGYEYAYGLYGAIFLRAWETATGESLLNRTTYMETLPYDVAKSRMGLFSRLNRFGNTTLEYCTGVNSPESASLAKWLLDQFERQINLQALVPRLLLGDLRVEAKSPQELGLPLFGYQDGANCVYVRSSWDRGTATSFVFFARCWDRGRKEATSGHLAIHKGDTPILPIGFGHKGIAADYTQFRVWNPGVLNSRQQGSTYWSNDRAYKAEDVPDPNKLFYRPETLTHLSESNGVVTATARFEKLLLVNTPLAERTVVMDPQAETVRITDRAELAEGLAAESNFGLHETPTITGNVIENSRIRITVNTPFTEIVWDTEERQTSSGGPFWTIGTVKIRPVVTDGNVTCEMLVEVK